VSSTGEYIMDTNEIAVKQKIKKRYTQRELVKNAKINLYFSRKTKEKLKRIAEKEGISMSLFVDNLIVAVIEE
jgi:hypothetical protein